MLKVGRYQPQKIQSSHLKNISPRAYFLNFTVLECCFLCFFRPFMKICEVGLFNTCLAMLKALIEVNLLMFDAVKSTCIGNIF